MRQQVTKREQTILNAIIDKRLFIRKDIAKYLKISESTVASHLLHLHNKLGTSSILELVFYELEKRGLL